MYKKGLLCFFSGFVVGVLMSLALGAYMSYKDPYLEITGGHRKFGDLKIDVVKMDANDTALTISKGDKIFFFAGLNPDNEVNQIMISGPNNEIRYTMYESYREGFWKNATYGTESGKGYRYLDKDYDGRFDVMRSDYDGNTFQSKYIFIEPNFIKVDFFEGSKAGNKDGSYIFETFAGWKKE
jgi:hypothetical protein